MKTRWYPYFWCAVLFLVLSRFASNIDNAIKRRFITKEELKYLVRSTSAADTDGTRESSMTAPNAPRLATDQFLSVAPKLSVFDRPNSLMLSSRRSSAFPNLRLHHGGGGTGHGTGQNNTAGVRTRATAESSLDAGIHRSMASAGDIPFEIMTQRRGRLESQNLNVLELDPDHLRRDKPWRPRSHAFTYSFLGDAFDSTSTVRGGTDLYGSLDVRLDHTNLVTETPVGRASTPRGGNGFSTAGGLAMSENAPLREESSSSSDS